MHFQHPAFLWLLPLVALVWFFPRRGAAGRRAVVRAVVLGALLVGLARPVVVRATWSEHHVVVVDRSASAAAPAAVEGALAVDLEHLDQDPARHAMLVVNDLPDRQLVELGGRRSRRRSCLCGGLLLLLALKRRQEPLRRRHAAQLHILLNARTLYAASRVGSSASGKVSKYAWPLYPDALSQNTSSSAPGA